MSSEEQPELEAAPASKARNETAPAPVTHCPSCKRKLLTLTSALCNWCGAKINDPDYQERAAQTRLAADATERARLAAIIQEEGRYGVLGRLRRRAKGDGPSPLGVDET